MKDCDRCSRGVVREPLQMAEEIWGVCVYLLFTSVSFTEISVSGKSSTMCGNYCLLISLKYRCGQLWSWTSVFCFGVCKRGECNHIKACGDVHTLYTPLEVTRDSKASSILVPWTVRQDMGPMVLNFWTVQKQIVLSSMKANWFKFYQML